MNVQMVYDLCAAAINDQTIAFVLNFLLNYHFMDNYFNFLQHLPIFEVKKIDNMFFWHNQKMRWRKRMNIRKNHNIAIFISKYFWNNSISNFAKNTVSHNFKFSRALLLSLLALVLKGAFLDS